MSVSWHVLGAMCVASALGGVTGAPLIGVNAVNLFWDRLSSGDLGATRLAMEEAAARGFKLVRFAASAFCPADMRDSWQLAPDGGAAYWEALDTVVNDAEELGLQLLPTVGWHFMVWPALCNETWGSFWRDPDSCGMSLFLNYTKQVGWVQGRWVARVCDRGNSLRGQHSWSVA